MTFKEECIAWLEPLGYSVHSSQGDSYYILFPDYKQPYNPTITCVTVNGEKYCRLRDSQNYKMFLTLDSGRIQFKHPDIEKYIRVFSHYSQLVENNPPW